jgi:hypothetical protein
MPARLGVDIGSTFIDLVVDETTRVARVDPLRSHGTAHHRLSRRRAGVRGVVLIDGVVPANPKAEQFVPPGALVEVRLPGGRDGPPGE